MDFKTLVSGLDNATYQNLKTAVEIGKWPDGRVLTATQREHAMDAVIAYEVEHAMPEELRTGFVDMGASECHTPDGIDNKHRILKWQH